MPHLVWLVTRTLTLCPVTTPSLLVPYHKLGQRSELFEDQVNIDMPSIVISKMATKKGGSRISRLRLSKSNCRELTTLWVARLHNSTELKVTDPKEQQRDVEEEETKTRRGGSG